MNSRERLLLITVVLLGVGLVAIYGYTSMTAAVANRTAQIAAIENQINQQKITVRRGGMAARNLKSLQERSLPANQGMAQTIYSEWLLNLVDEQVGLKDCSVIPKKGSGGNQYYSQLRFQVDGEATLEQVVAFLHGFYSSHDLHQIKNLRLKPIGSSDNRLLDFSADVEAIILPGNQRATVGDLASNRFGDLTLDDFQTVILSRNVFAPANKAPSISSISNKTTNRDERFTFTVKARDADELDNLTFRLEGDAPEGMEIDEEDGTLLWRPEENGEFQVRVAVSDDGTPSLSDIVDFKVTVKDPPPPPVEDEEPEPPRPRFDEAEHAYVIGTVSKGTDQTIWLKIRTTGKLLRLSVGDPINVGTVEGVIDSIGDKDVVILTDEGMLRVQVGQSLVAG